MFVGESIGPFRIERELGSGAMGSVYRATFTKEDGSQKPVALKIVALGLMGNESALARFERESNILQQMRHPNIVRLIATGRYKKTPFIAMEYVDGEPLDRALVRRGRLGWEEVFGYFRQLCDALQYAHDKGIIHRDLKPSNLMITKDGVLKLTDFGIAKDVDVTALTGMNSTIGTAAYMSPEQCKGDKHLSGKSDLYSLGVCMYELITGKKPFSADTTVDMFLKHVHDKPVRPTRQVPDLPIWVETMILHLLEKEPDKRPLDAATVGRMLGEIEAKVAAHESAGVAVANARRSDPRMRNANLDETDKEAARTLRDSKAGRRRRKPSSKSGSPRWLRFLPPVLGLAAIAAVLFFVFKPEGMSKHFARILAADTPDKQIEIASQFLDRYGNDGGESVDKAKAILREARGRKLDGILQTRFRTDKLRTAQENEDPTNYSDAWQALGAEQTGDLARAMDHWKAIKNRPIPADAYRDGWAWLSDNHLADIARIDEHLATIQKEIQDREIFETDWKYEASNPKSIATFAIRLQSPTSPTNPKSDTKPIPHLRDPAKAARAWQDLAEMTREKPAERSWWLLALRERRNFSEIKPESALAARQAALADQLQRIRNEWQRVANDPNLGVAQRDCRNRCRDIIELFADETDPSIKSVVAEAQKLLAEMLAKKN